MNVALKVEMMVLSCEFAAAAVCSYEKDQREVVRMSNN